MGMISLGCSLVENVREKKRVIVVKMLSPLISYPRVLMTEGRCCYTKTITTQF